jgi:hypothetical protein
VKNKAMKRSAKGEAGNPARDEMRDQEVVRATGELAAYFKGRRTEREARAALKTIKAFIKERERSDSARRRPLPGLEPIEAPAHEASRKGSKGATTARRKPRRRGRDRTVSDPVESQQAAETNDTPSQDNPIDSE